MLSILPPGSQFPHSCDELSWFGRKSGLCSEFLRKYLYFWNCFDFTELLDRVESSYVESVELGRWQQCHILQLGARTARGSQYLSMWSSYQRERQQPMDVGVLPNLFIEKSLGRSSAAPRSLTCARLTRIIFHAGKRRLLPQPLLLGQFHALVRMFLPSCTCEFSAGTCPDPSYTLYADSCKCYKLRSFCFGRDSLAQKPWDQALQCLHSQPFWRSFQRLPFWLSLIQDTFSPAAFIPGGCDLFLPFKPTAFPSRSTD